MSDFILGKKRAKYFNVETGKLTPIHKMPEEETALFERYDVIYRALCAILYNFAPLSGHPGGSISSGRFVQNLIYNEMAYKLSDPKEKKADIISYAAGHKALGLYAMWALRNECVAQAAPELLAKDIQNQMRLEDLLGFRRNEATATKYFKEFKSKPLGGHPEPVVPFVKTSTGASGVGVGSAVGMAFAAADAYSKNSPVINIIEGEGGLTAGRCSEVIAMAATANINNLVLHLDWNQASIDSDRVTSDGENPGDYVQWTPLELFYINDWNVVFVPEGHNYEQIYAAQKYAFNIKNGQPTAIIYRTVKGWKYGLEGKSSHGSGHKFASEGFHNTLSEFESVFGVSMPRFCGEQTPQGIEDCFWGNLQSIREALKKDTELAQFIAKKVFAAAERLNNKNSEPSPWLGDVEKVYSFDFAKLPAEFNFKQGESYATRTVLGDVLGYINKESGGTFLVGSADLYGSTNAGNIAKAYPKGFYNKARNPESRLVADGGICEDGLNALATGISAYGKHIGVAASYAAFASFGHVAMRLHAIGQEANHVYNKENINTVIQFNGHSGIPTGEDGPTHADPQALQLFQENFPKGLCITLTPFEVDEIWPMVTYALSKRPAVLAPFVMRPSEKMIDRAKYGADPAHKAVNGIYRLCKADGKADVNIIIQGSGVARNFINGTFEKLAQEGVKANVWYVCSKELFDMLPLEEQEKILPYEVRQNAMAITDFTVPTIANLLLSAKGQKHMLWPHKNGKYLGSGKHSNVYKEAGLDADGQLSAILSYIKDAK
ncbi:Transketolase central region [Elusimicrobium minutum Pei191]|uniref:Transketolase central region n=1 Tax=Elusimicrobium minutum (strain Pei191) TaxID=445932 RepID=B2KB92_ELUMP|nr:transketolase [Elusimicrobium minutum]ACC97914.1 Transketolase central region [Elusimicrobium minutum Pei191]